MKHLIIKEIAEIIKDFRFSLIIFITIIFGIISAVVSSRKYENFKNEYDFVQNYYYNQTDNKPLDEIARKGHLAMRAPYTSIFISSLSSNFPDKSNIVIPNLWFDKDISSYFPRKEIGEKFSVSNFIRFDMMFFVEMVLSFLFLFLVYNSISKEKETGTLKLLLSNSIGRHKLLLSKLLVYISLICLSLIILVLTELITIFVYGSIPIDISILNKIILFIINSIFYLVFWVLIGAMVSIISKNSSSSLSYSLVVWVLVSLVLPFSSAYIISKNSSKQPFDIHEIIGMYEEIDSDMWKFAKTKNATWRGGNIPLTAKDNHIKEKNLHPIYLNYLEKFNQYQYTVVKRQIDQLKQMYTYSSLSPAFLFRRITESLMGVGYETNYKFLDALQTYRSDLISFFKKEDLKDKESLHLTFFPRYMSKKKVSVKRMPLFSINQYRIDDIFVGSWPLIMVFFAEILIVFLITHFSFLKYDPR